MLANRQENEMQNNINRLLIEAAKNNNPGILEIFLTHPPENIKIEKLLEIDVNGYLIEIRREMKSVNYKVFTAWENWIRASYDTKISMKLFEEQKGGVGGTLEQFFKNAEMIAKDLQVKYLTPSAEKEFSKNHDDVEGFLAAETKTVELYVSPFSGVAIKSLKDAIESQVNEYNYKIIMNFLTEQLKTKSEYEKRKKDIFQEYLSTFSKCKLEAIKSINYLERLNYLFPAITKSDKELIKKYTLKDIDGLQLVSLASRNEIPVDAIKDLDKNTLLNIASNLNHSECVKILLKMGSNPLLENNHGISALQNLTSHYVPYQDNAVIYEMLTQASNRITHDDSNLERYPKMAEFIEQRIIGLKIVLDKYVEGVQERLRKHWPSMQFALKLDITKERAETIAKLYKILHEGIKEGKYHVVLEEVKLIIEGMKKTGKSQLYLTAFTHIQASYQWLKDNYEQYHNEYDKFIRESEESKWQGKVNELSATIKTSESACRFLLNENNRLRDEITRLNGENSQLREESRNDLTNFIEKDANQINQINLLNDQIDNLNIEINNLKSQLEDLIKKRQKTPENGGAKPEGKRNSSGSSGESNYNPFNIFVRKEDKEDKEENKSENKYKS